MNLRDLQICLDLSVERHFGRTAVRANLSQPAVSQAVKRVERLLGARIFVRDSHGVRLSPLGARLMPHIAAVLEEATLLADVARATSAPAPEAFSLGYSPWMRSRLRALLAAAATVDVQLVPRVLPVEAQREMLCSGRLDVACLPSVMAPRGARAWPMPPLRLTTLVSPRSRAPDRPSRLIVPAMAASAVRPALRDLTWPGLRGAPTVHEVEAPETLLDEVVAGAGVGVFDTCHLDASARGLVRLMTLPTPVPAVPHVLVALERSGHRPASVDARLVRVLGDLARTAG